MIIFRNDIQKGGKDYEEVAERLLRLINQNEPRMVYFLVRTWKEQEQHLLDETAKKIKENDKLKERNQFLEEWKDRLVRERTELQEKLQRTYDEKSEINRKLQQTYSEKFDRGVEIKELKQINRELKKKIDGIKGCKTYRLARCIGFPVRMWRKLIRG